MSDIVLLMIAVILGMLHLGVTAQLAQKYRTPDWGFGPRDTPMETGGVAARLERAYRNFMETFPLFAAALLAVVLQNKSAGLSHWGAILYVVGRIAYVPMYAFGVKYVRTVCWFVATVGIILLIVAAMR